MATTTTFDAPPSRRASGGLGQPSRLQRVGVWGLIVLALASTLVPIYFIVAAAFNPVGTLSTAVLVPRKLSLDNFSQLFDDPNTPFLRWMGNSLIVSVSVTVITLITVATSSYAFSRMRFVGREGLLLSIILLQVFPNLLAIVAIFQLIQQLGDRIPALGLNSPVPLILIYVAGAIGGSVFLLKGYMDSIPKDIDESALIDGASHWMIFSRLLFPLVRPMLAVVAVLTFVAAYSEILIVQVLIRDPDEFTLPVGLYTMSISQFTIDWGLFAAGAILAALPPLVLFYTLQKWLVAGLTQGAVKG